MKFKQTQMQNLKYPLTTVAFSTLISIFLPKLSLNNFNHSHVNVLFDSPQALALDMSTPFPYQLDKPDWVQTLPSKLKEISGITYWQGALLLCIQDETGRIYAYNFKKERITVEFPFAGSGDYEDIAWVDPVLYVLRSDGDLYQIKGLAEFDTQIQKFENFLGQEQDTEGLGFDKTRQELLIAGKGDAFNADLGSNAKEVYRFSLQQEELLSQTRFTIKQEELRKLDPDAKTFKPSGIARNPKDGNFYILSGASQSLLVLDDQGAIVHLLDLDKDLFPQAESICFDEEAHLFIATEASGKKPRLARFSYR